jgi:apolipoprotein N-acyltransferase
MKEYLTANFFNKTSRSRKAALPLFATTAVAGALVLAYGMFRLYPSINKDRSGPGYSIAVIQANIPQEIKWEKTAWIGIMDKYVAMTKEALPHGPDLIIWPETSYPGYLWEDKELFTQLQVFVRSVKIPLLLGSVLKEDQSYYNAAILLSGNGDIAGIYRKVHLVPFGEYLPLRAIFPFLSDLVAIGDFTAGDRWTTFSPMLTQAGHQPDQLFSVLICFEDTVARVARQFVNHGAQLLVNITNDAWFGDTKAPFMHLQSAVFRTVENRKGLVRAANTGASCFIDQWGRTTRCVENDIGGDKQKTYISGYAIEKVDFNDKMTFYTKYGDVFTILCFGCILLGIIQRKRAKGPDKYC